MNGASFKVIIEKRFVVNLFEHEDFLKGLVDMLSMFVVQVAPKNWSFYPPTR
jgi:hypothetical protein